MARRAAIAGQASKLLSPPLKVNDESARAGIFEHGRRNNSQLTYR